MISVSLPCSNNNWLRCKVGKQCVLPDKWCDYRVDCIDGSDEENCGELEFHKNSNDNF